MSAHGRQGARKQVSGAGKDENSACSGWYQPMRKEGDVAVGISGGNCKERGASLRRARAGCVLAEPRARNAAQARRSRPGPG